MRQYMILYLYTIIQQLLQICGVPGPAPCKGSCNTNHRNCKGTSYTKRCNCKGSILQGIAIAIGLFHSTLQLLLYYFTGALKPLQGYFTGPCNCYRSISPGLAIATGLFHQTLQLLLDYFTGPCNCYRVISLGLAIAIE